MGVVFLLESKEMKEEMGMNREWHWMESQSLVHSKRLIPVSICVDPIQESMLSSMKPFS